MSEGDRIKGAYDGEGQDVSSAWSISCCHNHYQYFF